MLIYFLQNIFAYITIFTYKKVWNIDNIYRSFEGNFALLRTEKTSQKVFPQISTFHILLNKVSILDIHLNRMNYLRLNKKVVLFREIGQVKIVLSLTRPHGWMCIRMCTRIRKKPNNLKTKKLVTRTFGNKNISFFLA